ncbi:MAG: hypothetical protein AAB553_06760 [Patescibacteria group bacterium]
MIAYHVYDRRRVHIMKPSKKMHKEKGLGTAAAAVLICFLIIAVFISPWIVYYFIPEVSSLPGYSSPSRCNYAYLYLVIFGSIIPIAFLIYLISKRTLKHAYYFKVFLLLLFLLVVSTAIVAFGNNVTCTFNPIIL